MPVPTTAPSSEASSSPEASGEVRAQSPKRTAADAGLKANGARPAKAVKRRASKACQSCRARKVRCNVVEHGPPCTNCRLDEVDCVVSESKRKKKWPPVNTAITAPAATNAASAPQSQGSAVPNASNGSSTAGNAIKPTLYPASARPTYIDAKKSSEHVPHTLYQDLPPREAQALGALPRPPMTELLANLQRLGHRTSISPSVSGTPAFMGNLVPPQTPAYSLPLYIKPLPSKLGLDDILYLEKKGALAIPGIAMRDELLRNYAEYVHPYMPLLNLHDMIATIDSDDGAAPISLLLFQAIMFSATAFIDIRHLKRAGYHSRRDARRDFFQKARLLYDFDIEVDRVSLIQALLLMTYWYETPDDQKDSHHWMGIVVSLSHTIGLHRNSAKSTTMDDARKKLWKRIWWSIYMRDRLIALGMRRPTRVKDSDFDVPMLTIDDFEDAVMPEGPSCISSDCKVLRDVETQRQLAVMCVEKAKLCVCISHVLSVQYSVLSNNHGEMSEEGSTITTVRLSAKKRDPEVFEVQICDQELTEWKDALPAEAQYYTPSWQDLDAGDDSIVLNRSLLYMVYYATISALHRPQVLPSSAMPPRQLQAEMLDHSRKSVRHAAAEITNIANALAALNMTRFLPTTGITVLLPAIIIHLLDIKAPDEATRRASLQGFCQVMQILGKLRDIYAAADYSAAFLEAAIRKAEITLPQKPNDEVKDAGGGGRSVITSTQGLVEAGRRIGIVGLSLPPSRPSTGALTPPPDEGASSASGHLPREPHFSSSSSSTSSNVGGGGGGASSHNHYHQHRRALLPAPPKQHHHTITASTTTAQHHLTDANFSRTLNPFLASTPPDSDGHQQQHHGLSSSTTTTLGGGDSSSHHHGGFHHHHQTDDADASYITIPQHPPPEMDTDFDTFINLDAAGDVMSLDEGAFAAMSGESGGFTMDMDWLKGMKDDGLEMVGVGAGAGLDEA